MKSYKLAETERLLREIVYFLNDNMKWIKQRRIDEKYLDTDHDILLYNIVNEMEVVHDKIQKYLKEE